MRASVKNGIYSAILFKFHSPKKILHENYVKSEKIPDPENHKTYNMKQEGSNYGRDKN